MAVVHLNEFCCAFTPRFFLRNSPPRFANAQGNDVVVVVFAILTRSEYTLMEKRHVSVYCVEAVNLLLEKLR